MYCRLVWLCTCFIFSSTLCGDYPWNVNDFLDSSDQFSDFDQLFKQLDSTNDTVPLHHTNHTDSAFPLLLENQQLINSASMLPQHHTPCSPRGIKRPAPDSCNFLAHIQNSPAAAIIIPSDDPSTSVKNEIVQKISYGIHTIAHMRTQIRQLCNEKKYPGICVNILNELRTHTVQPHAVSYRETIITILKLHALRQCVSLPTDAQSSHDKSQLNTIALNTCEAACADFFSNSDFIAEEFSQAIECGMFHPSMIDQLNNRYRQTQFKQCLKSAKASIKSFEARKKLIEYYTQNRQKPTQEIKTDNEYTILKMFESWQEEMPNLPNISLSQAPVPQTIAQQSSENDPISCYPYAPGSQQYAIAPAPNGCCNNSPACTSSENPIGDIVNNVAALMAIYTPEECRMQLVSNVHNYIYNAPQYGHFLTRVFNMCEESIAPTYGCDQQYIAQSPPQMHSLVSTDEYVGNTSPVTSPIRCVDMAPNPPTNEINTSHQKHALTPYGEEFAGLLKIDPNNTANIRRYIDRAYTHEKYIDVIKALQNNMQTTEFHLTLAKLTILGKGIDLSAASKSHNHMSPHEDSGSQRTSIALNTSPEASRKFFCEESLCIKQLKDGVKYGMFHESMVFQVAKKAKSADSFHKFMYILTNTMSAQQFDSLCEYYKQHKDSIQFDMDKKHQKRIAKRLHNFHTSTYEQLKATVRKKRKPYRHEEQGDYHFINQNGMTYQSKYKLS